MSRALRTRRVTAVWAVLAALLVLVTVIEGTSLFTPTLPERTGRLPVFDFTEAQLGAVEAVWQGRVASVVRDDAGLWLSHEGGHRHGAGAQAAEGEDHHADPETSDVIAARLDTAARMLADRRIPIERGLEEYGLAKPPLMVAFYGRGESGPDYTRPLDVLYVGDLLTTEYTYYALRDGEREISLVPRYQIALLLALIFGEQDAPTPLPERPATAPG
jgi:hypothetical protein